MTAKMIRPAPDQTAMPARRLLAIALAAAMAAGCVAMGNPGRLDLKQPRPAAPNTFRG
ncbi:MAG TPA: hypothetical protein VG735_11565 [Caulobacterales bacterium]|nr:hypothetical protein [Caulobacterales bacterium]